jgi:ATP-dependent Clp protease ATP-binding subunit ClpB
MTSNIASGLIFERENIDSMEFKEELDKILRQYFKPEFINRLDDIIVFHRLSEDNLKQIARYQLNLLKQKLQQRGISVEFTENAITYIAKKGFDPQFGARPLKRLIQKEIENQLALEILSGRVSNENKIIIDSDGDKIVFQL